MSEFLKEHLESLTSHLSDVAPLLAESVNQTLEQKFEATIDASSALDSSSIPDGPGMAVLLGTGESMFAAWIPEDLPLPDWYQDENLEEDQTDLLGMISTEWSAAMLPEPFFCDQSEFKIVKKFSTWFAEYEPTEWAVQFPIQLKEEGSEEDSGKTIWLMGPFANTLETPEEEVLETASEATLDSVSEVEQDFPQRAAASASQSSMNLNADQGLERVRRLMNLKVPVSVRLAEKRIEMGQLLKLSLGSLIMFTKPCDDFLDMYVNNQLFCRGEAVKIGERFGLKINEIGIEEERDSGVLNF